MEYQVYDWPFVTMVAIAGAESGWDNNAISPTNDFGIFQINRSAWPELFNSGSWSDPKTNTSWAFHVWQQQGLTAWTTYFTGAYQQYVPQAQAAVAQVQGNPYAPVPTGPTGGPPPVNALDASQQITDTATAISNAGWNLAYWENQISRLW